MDETVFNIIEKKQKIKPKAKQIKTFTMDGVSSWVDGSFVRQRIVDLLTTAYGEPFIRQFIKKERGETITRPTLIGRVNSQIEFKKKVIEKPKKLVNKSTLGVDWLQGTVDYSRLVDVLELLTLTFGHMPVAMLGGIMRGYNRTCSFVPLATGHGVNVIFHDTKEKSGVRGETILIQITGQGTSRLDYNELRKLGDTLKNDYNFSCSRIDTCFNDYDRIISVAEIKKEVEKGNFSGFKKPTEYKKGELTSEGLILTGDTVAFGSRGNNGSGKYARIYDKGMESDGKEDCIRYEIEWSLKRSKVVFEDLFGTEDLDEFIVVLAGHIGGAILFVDRSKNEKNIERLKLLPWWRKIVDMLGRSVFSIPAVESTIEGTKQHLWRNTARSFAKVRRSFHSDDDFCMFFDEILMKGEDSLTQGDFVQLEEFGCNRPIKSKEAVGF